MNTRTESSPSAARDVAGGPEQGPGVELSTEAESQLERILALVRTKTGHDFREYKRNTIVRRIQRRMRITGLTDFEAYCAHLIATPDEAALLLQDLLIGVTHFFRDPAAFEALRLEAIPKLVQHKSPGSTLRVWVAGCASGEEAYSLALSFSDYIDKNGLDLRLQLFASDIDDEALRVARLGRYPKAIEDDIPPELLSQYLSADGDGYRVNKRIRDSVIFSSHNVLTDPPFSKLDLISCRNLLIYFSAELQSRLIPLFHYALLPRGYLLLGSAEGLSALTNLFSVVDKKQRLFQRRELPGSVSSHFDFATPAARRSASPRGAPATAPPLPSLIERVLLDTYAPPCVVINEKLDVVYFVGKTGRYLQTPEGNPTVHLLELARPGLRTLLRACVHQAIAEHQVAIRHGIETRTEVGIRHLSVTVRPVEDTSRDGLYLVIFEEEDTLETNGTSVGDEAAPNHPAVDQLESELRRTEQQLRILVEDFETSSEELKSSNEELLSTNEELQSSNEELETAKEEVQSVNEELETVNSELKSKVDALARANGDIRNLFDSTRIATLFLDRDLQIQNFTPATRELFRLIDTDRGRPISDIAQRFHYDHLLSDVRAVIESLEPSEAQLRSHEGGWFIMRVLPYRSLENVVEGAVVTFTDVTQLKHAELEVQRLSKAYENQLRWLRALTDVAPVGIAYHEKGMQGVRINRAALRVLQLPSGAVPSDGDLLSHAVFPDGMTHPDLGPLQRAVTSDNPVNDLEIELGNGEDARHLMLSSVPLVDATLSTYGQVSTFLDITEIKRAREQAFVREQQQAIIAELGMRALEHGHLTTFLCEGAQMLCDTMHCDVSDVMQVADSRLELRSLCRGGWKDPAEVSESLTPGSWAEAALGRAEPTLFQRGSSPPSVPDYLSEEGIESGVRINISSNNQQPFGLLGIYARSRREFSKQDLDFLKAGALVITSAIQRQTIEQARLRERETAALRRSEEQLRRAERLASLGTLATGIAHEINNPLNNISLAAEYAEQSTDAGRRNKLLASIKNNAQRCGQIVESVLRFGGDDLSERGPVDVGSVVRQAIVRVSSEFDSSRLTVVSHLQDDLPRLLGNPAELEMIFVNLFRNAAQAHGGHCHVTLEAFPANPYLRLVVSDDGPGIPAVLRSRVFDPFFSTRRAAGRTGMGLSIAHGIVMAHSGSIRIASEEGTGTTFVIELPLALEG